MSFKYNNRSFKFSYFYSVLKHLIIIFCLSFPFISFSQEKSEWSLEANFGFPVNINHPLTIQQNGYDDINFTANFESKPFQQPFFYVYRISKWKNNKGWEFEMMHQKLFLENPPEEVEYLIISHGFNLMILSRALKISVFKENDFVVKFGTGFVLAHPESSIREKVFDQKQSFLKLGYYVTGPVLNLGFAKHFKISNRFYFNLECKFNTSYGNVPIVDGNLTFWHSAFAFTGGLNYSFIKRQ